MPVTPGATGASFDVLLAFSLDPEANNRVKQGVTTLNQELERIQKEAAQVGTEYKESGEQIKRTSKEVSRELTAQARVMRREAAAITDDLAAAQVSALKNISGFIGDLSQRALIAGSALTIGIFAEVNRYVKEAPNATAATREWTAATEELGKARSRIDNVLLRESLPLLQQAARIANQIAGFVEQNPEVASIALKSGLILAGIGTIGLAVSRGIKLVADISALGLISQQLTAAKLQDVAADKQLAAAQIRAGQTVTPAATPAGGGLSTLVSSAALIVAGLVASAAVVGWVDSILERSGFGEARRSAIDRARDQGARIYPGVLPPAERDLQAQLNRAQQAGNVKEIERLRKEIDNLGNQAKDTSSAIADATGILAGSENEAAVVEAFSKWKDEDARLIREASEERKQIITEGEKQIADITRKYASERSSINTRFDRSRSDLTRQFAEESARAEEQYHQSRAETIASGNEQLRQIAEEHQERLRQIEQDGADRLDEFARSRDALGLAKAEREIEQERQEETRSTQRAREQARRETEARLAELAQSFAAEQAQRRQQLEQALKENEIRRQEELKAAAEANQEELRQAREAQAQKLRELQEGLNAERLRRREVFIAEIRDLDAALLGERGLKLRNYQQTLIDAQNFFNSYRRIMTGGTGTSPIPINTYQTRDSGGYVDRGLYRMAWDNVREFVLSGPSTKAAERIVGGALTQNNLMRALSSGSGRNINYVDNRRMESPMSKDDRAVFQKMAEEALLFAIGAQ